MKFFLYIFLFLSIISSTVSANELVKWYSLNDALKAQKTNYKPIFVDVYTDWCGWCKKMDQATFNNPDIAKLLNNSYYPVKFDAEGNDTITFKGITYVNSNWAGYQQTMISYEKALAEGQKVRKPRKPTHDISKVLLNGKMSYPTTVYIHENEEYFPVPGYMEPNKIQPLLLWVAEGANKTSPYDAFLSAFNETYVRPSTDLSEKVNWLSFDQALENQKKSAKKILISFEADWVFSSQIMKTVLRDSLTAEYLNEHYYCIRFDAVSTEKIVAFGNTWENNSEQKAYHPLVSAMLKNDHQFPALVWLDENSKLINQTKGFLSTPALFKMLTYFGDDAYKTMDWSSYSSSKK